MKLISCYQTKICSNFISNDSEKPCYSDGLTGSNTPPAIVRNNSINRFNTIVNSLLYLLVIASFLSISGCTDPNQVVDDSASIINQNWSYGNKAKFDIQIDDPAIAYNLYFNLRVTANYKYSNMFVLIYQSGGSLKKAQATRYELKLATPTGEWLGQGSGSMYSYQIPFKTSYRFPAKGRFHFEIEQNMRDNPLRSVSDIGLRIEKAE